MSADRVQAVAEPGGVRLDLWLWAARFFRTRALAKHAVEGGKVEVNNTSAKPSKLVRTGDLVQVRRGDDLYVVAILGVSDTRGSAPIAQTLYAETDASRLARDIAREQRCLAQPTGPQSRPDKKSRRQISKLEKTPDDGLPPWWPR